MLARLVEFTFDFHCINVNVSICVQHSATNTMPELKKNILNFGYGASFKYEECYHILSTDFM